MQREPCLRHFSRGLMCRRLYRCVQVLARANRERLRVLLSEAEQGRLGDNERYAAALRCACCFSQQQMALQCSFM